MDFASQDFSVSDDVVVVGGGFAGLYCALKLAPRSVTLITPHPVGRETGAVAVQQGLSSLSQDIDFDTLAAETDSAGCGVTDRRMADLMAREAPAGIRDLIDIGARGNMTEGEVTATLMAAVRDTPSIRLFEGYALEDLVKERNQVAGLVAIADDPIAGPAEIRLAARAVVLASGGIGALYARTTNSAEARGQGLATAARAGALIADTEFVQFRPAAETADADATPPGPTAHFHMGGVLTDANGRASVDGLWACGEVAATGVHGAGRLPANPLIEAVVFAARAARDVCTIYPAPTPMPTPVTIPGAGAPGLFQENDATEGLRQVMSEHVGVARNRDGLLHALRRIAELERMGGATHGFRNMISAARMITFAALERTESRGVHCRTDYPEEDPDQARRNAWTLRQMENRIRALTARAETAFA